LTLASLTNFGLTPKLDTRLERLARAKHSSLLQKSANYGHKNLIVLALDNKRGNVMIRKCKKVSDT
jgi:hypothetical protein